MGKWRTIKEIKAEILAEKDIIKRAEGRVLYLRSLLARKQYTVCKMEEYVQRVLYNSTIDHVTFEELISSKGTKNISQIRHIMAYHLYYDRQIPIEKIGKLFGRHHSTMITGRDKIKAELAVFEDIQKYYYSIREAARIIDQQGFKLIDE